jgi:hypothetical protein
VLFVFVFLSLYSTVLYYKSPVLYNSFVCSCLRPGAPSAANSTCLEAVAFDPAIIPVHVRTVLEEKGSRERTRFVDLTEYDCTAHG